MASIQSYTPDLAAAGLHQDASGVWHGPLAVLSGGTPYCFSTTGTAGAAAALNVPGGANAYTILKQIFVSGTGLPIALASTLMTITGANQNFLDNIWSGPALGLKQTYNLSGWGLVASAQNQALVVTVAALTGVTISITGIGIYV